NLVSQLEEVVFVFAVCCDCGLHRNYLRAFGDCGLGHYRMAVLYDHVLRRIYLFHCPIPELLQTERMRTAYNENWLKNLLLVKEAKQWMASGIISKEQFAKIAEAFPSQFYHPNLIIRILLFLATGIVLSAITGLLILAVMDSNEDTIGVLSIIYGLISLL